MRHPLSLVYTVHVIILLIVIGGLVSIYGMSGSQWEGLFEVW